MKGFAVAVLIILSAFAFAKTEKSFETGFDRISDSELSVHFTMDNVSIGKVIENGVTYSTLSCKGVRSNDKGYAELPRLSAAVMLGEEYDMVISSVAGDYEEISLDHPLLPSRGTIYRNQDPNEIPYIIDPKSVTDSWYPEQQAFTNGPYIFRDVRGENVYAYPVLYNAEKQKIRIYKDLTVFLKEDNSKSTNPLKVKPDYVVPAMDDIYRSMFVNYSESKFTHQLGEFGEILVIYTSRDASVIQPYIDWKREKGFKVSTTQVSTGTNVKTTVANAYSSNPNILYVQLVGDWADIKCDLGGGDSSPMDPMLGDTGSDSYPEMIVGRFSANSTTDVTVQVNKTITYEKSPDMSGTWYKNGLGIGSSEGSGIGDDGEIDYAHIDIIKENKLLPYTYTTVNEAYGSPTATTVANYVNAGLGVINYCGHGANTYWVTSSYSNTNISSSTNGSKLPFIFSVACVNGEFDVTTCFAEAWLRKSGGGAVATLMSTINQPWVPPMIGQDYMNDILVGGYNYSTQPGDADYSPVAGDKRTTFGSITLNGNMLMLTEDGSTDAYNTIKTWTVFGDASLQVRTDTPKTLTVSNTTVSTGSAYTTNIKAAGSNFQNALVSIYQNGNTYAGFTDSSGNVTINHSCTAGSAKLTVTGYNTETKSLDITVGGGSTEPPSSPVLASPSNGSTTYDLTPSFDWSDASGATSYTIQVDNNSAFTSPEINQTVTSSTYTPSSNLALGIYYWRVLATNAYGSSSYTSSWTLTVAEAQAATLPFYENFNASTSLPSGWEIIDNQGSGQVWQFGTHTSGLSGADGNYAYLNSDGYGSGNTQNTDLVTPLINMTGASNVTLSFSHYFRSYTGSSATLSYSINGGSTWTQVQQWTATTTNPV
nr:C25 family cysteine peptidase [Clostridiales bacterium]